MKKITIRDIEIQYNDEQANKIDYIINTISKNYGLFLDVLGTSRIISLVPTDEKNTLYIENFDEAFYSIIDKCFNNDTVKQEFNAPNIMPALYVEILLRKLKIKSKVLIQSNSNISDETLDSLIAYKYFEKNGSFSEFVEYLKTRNESDLIFNWLKNEFRWDTYNYLLEITVNYLKEYDFDFLENISDINTMMMNQTVNNIVMQESEQEVELPTITIEELDNLFNEFLKYINAPIKWKQLYDELKNSGRISFEKQTDGLDASNCYRDDNGALRISISTDGTIKCFISLVHEFMHYVSKVVSTLSISEFPSIFFEKVSAQFLKDKGYKEDIVNKIVAFRNKNNMDIYTETSPLFNDITAFIKDGPIKRERKIKYWENHFRIIQETKEKLAKMLEENGETVDSDILKQPNIDIPTEVDKDCDILIESFIQNGLLVLLVIDGYQYLLDTFLADEVLKQTTTDPTVISKMIKTTEELGNMNLQSVLDLFNMQDVLSKDSGNTLSRKRVK